MTFHGETRAAFVDQSAWNGVETHTRQADTYFALAQPALRRAMSISREGVKTEKRERESDDLEETAGPPSSYSKTKRGKGDPQRGASPLGSRRLDDLAEVETSAATVEISRRTEKSSAADDDYYEQSLDEAVAIDEFTLPERPSKYVASIQTFGLGSHPHPTLFGYKDVRDTAKVTAYREYLSIP
jgi:hypothetical protein